MLATPPSLLEDDAFDWKSAVASRIVLGGSASGERESDHSSSTVVPGALVPVDREHCASIRHALSSLPSAPTVVVRGVVAINGDFSFADLSHTQRSSPDDVSSVELVFVHGDVGSRTMDACWRERASQQFTGCRCVPVGSYKELERLAELSGAHIVDSWAELLPFAVGRDPITLRLVEVSATAVGDDEVDNDSDSDHNRGTRSYATLFLQVDRFESTRSSLPPLQTLLVRGATWSEAQELEQSVWKALRRITSTLRCGRLLPSGGAYLCACTAEIQIQAAVEQQRCSGKGNDGRVKNALTGVAMERVADALSRLCVQLLQNTGITTSGVNGGGLSFFDHFARVQEVQRNYRQGIQQAADDEDDGRTKFYAACNFGGADFSVLPYTRKPGEQNRRFDDYRSVKAAFRRSFRVVELALSVAVYQIASSTVPHQF